MQKNRKPPGYYIALRKFIGSLRHINFMSGEGELQNNWRVFETSSDARKALGVGYLFVSGEELKREADVAAMGEAFKVKAFDRDFIYSSISRNIRHALVRQEKDIDDTSLIASEALCMATCIVAWNSQGHEYTRRVAEFWNVWLSGYGLAGEHDGQLYVYRRRERADH